MGKDGFLQALSDALGSLDQQQKSDILLEFDMHFDMARRDGKNEADVCRALGDPAVIASQYFLYGALQHHTENPETETTRPMSEAADETSMVDIAEVFEAEGLTAIEVEVKQARVVLRGSKNKAATVRIQGRTEGSRFWVTCANGRLTLREEQNGFVQFLTRQSHRITAEITLPGSVKAAVQIVNNGGETDIEGVSMDHLTVFNAAGRVSLAGSTIGQVQISTAAGEVQVQACTARRFDIRSDTSGVTVERCTGDITIHAPDGRMRVFDSSGRVAMIASEGAPIPHA